ncbi:MAG: hypothetical protein Q8Q88_19595 [Phenylobacterium sp.]|uniref:hypothetical protein n=1 Tax=Phenylobacterium sp. TaxID=1871053 RepID=UPI00273521C7|nr:hypothetical protein [Phenylobacterium sp.]MDP3749246.1 hypothetical protein [Phenylobacterium sp.]
MADKSARYGINLAELFQSMRSAWGDAGTPTFCARSGAGLPYAGQVRRGQEMQPGSRRQMVELTLWKPRMTSTSTPIARSVPAITSTIDGWGTDQPFDQDAAALAARRPAIDLNPVGAGPASRNVRFSFR